MATSLSLCFGVGGSRRLNIADPTGADERAAAGEASVLLARLIHRQLPSDEMTVGDRDRALAALYRDMYGDAVRADAVCAGCAGRFEMRFDLSALVDGRQPDGSAAGTPPMIRVSGSVLRLPQIADLVAADTAQLLERLLVEGPVPDAGAATEALARADPALELDLSGSCPDCAQTQAVAFSMTRFFGAALRLEQDVLMREVHLLARHYRWGLGDILSLTRTERRRLYAFIVADVEGIRHRMGSVA